MQTPASSSGDAGLASLGRIGKYELLKQLAVGGMAEIFLARQTGVEGFTKLVVLKRILPNLAQQDRFVKMFLDEARLAARFTHPNIVQIYDLGQDGESYFIAMEYVHGEDIKAIVRRCVKMQQRIPLEHVVKIMSGVLDGLHYAHTQQDLDGRMFGVVHRDVSPHNIIVSFQGGVKLVDFGIAKARSEISTTIPGRVKGKHAYMSPEQVQGLDLDSRSDVFSAGTVMYELLTWTRLFKRKGDVETLKAVLSDPIRSPRELNPEVPEELERIALRALERDLERRYQSAQEMQLALEDFLLTKGLKSNPVLLSRFLSDLFADKLESRQKALHEAQAEDLEKVVLTKGKQEHDLVAFLDMFFADASGSSSTASPVALGDADLSPEFTPSGDYTPAGHQRPDTTRPRTEIPTSAVGQIMPRRAPPLKAPPGMELLGQIPGQASPPQPLASPVPQTPAAAIPVERPEWPPAAPLEAPAEIVDPDRYADELESIGKRAKGRGFLVVLFLLLLIGGAICLVVYREQLFQPRIPEFGLLRVRSIPAGADVFLDDVRQQDLTPMEVERVTPGVEHKLKLGLPGLPDWEKTFVLEDTTKPLVIEATLDRQVADTVRMKGAPVVAFAEGEGVGSLRVSSQPTGGQIFLDGVDAEAKTPHAFREVAAGIDHAVMVIWPSGPPAYGRFKLEPGKSLEMQFVQEPQAVPAPDRITVTVETEPEGATVSINGFPLSKKSPVNVAMLSSAVSMLELEAPGYRKWTRDVRPIPGVDLTLFIKLKK